MGPKTVKRSWAEGEGDMSWLAGPLLSAGLISTPSTTETGSEVAGLSEGLQVQHST